MTVVAALLASACYKDSESTAPKLGAGPGPLVTIRATGYGTILNPENVQVPRMDAVRFQFITGPTFACNLVVTSGRFPISAIPYVQDKTEARRVEGPPGMVQKYEVDCRSFKYFSQRANGTITVVR